jgi:hypothetical protein
VPVLEAAAVAGRVARARRLGADVAEWHRAGVQFAAGLCLAQSVAIMGRSYEHTTTTRGDRLSPSQRAFSGTQAQFR